MNNFIFATYSCMSNKLSNQYPNILPICWVIVQFPRKFFLYYSIQPARSQKSAPSSSFDILSQWLTILYVATL